MINNRFEVGELLGEGGMGSVYRAVDSHTGQTVAIKKLKPEMVANPDLLSRFASEAEALRLLNHPNIVKVLATLQEKDQHYLVMEYVSGGSLYDLLAETPRLNVSRVLEIALDLSDAIARAHRLNIIHRDLKPANVLLGDDEMPLLTDFGVARIIGSAKRLTETGATVGTLDYLSPEALNGEEADARADIWAFGVMLYEMLAGQRPFAGKSAGQVITEILTRPTPDLEALRPDVPIALVDLVNRMLEKDRAHRIPSIRQAGAEIEALLHGYDTQSQKSLKRFDSQPALFQTPTPTPNDLRHNLPAQTTPFVGRESEIITISDLLNDPNVRLATILGPGGMGKTRLALEVAGTFLSPQISANTPTTPPTPKTASRHNFMNGIYFVPLAPLTAPEFIVPTIAESIRFSFYGNDDLMRQLLDYLREKSMLLVLDNFEHIISGASIVADILKAAPDVKVLATSRERLNLHGESLFTIQGMDFPDWEAPENTLEYSAVKLFLQSARRAQPGYELAASDLPYLARICRLVRGMPLGIELAAAWADTLRLDEIAAEIEGSLDFLETEMRDAPERHRSIRAVFEYSWSLLADDERDVFIKLSVFRGGFTRDAAMTISGASLRNLTALVNKSLLARDPNGRYQIHELLRQYAEERLQQSDQSDAIYAAHCAYYADYIGSMYDDFAKMADQTLIKLALVELDNLRTALRWAVDHDRLAETRSFILPLIIIAQLRGLYLEGVEGLERVQAMLKRLELTIEVQEADLVASIMLGWLYMRFGDIAKSKSVLEHGCELMEVVQPPIGAEEPFSALGMIHSIMGDYQTATQLAEQGLAFNRSRDDDGSSMLSFYTLTSAAFGQGDYVAAKAYSEQALVCTEKVNQRWFAAYVHIDLGNIARVMGDYSAARHHYQTCYDIRKEYGDPEGMAVSLKNLGRVATLEGDPKEAKRLYEESLVLYKDIGDRGGLATTYTGLGAALCALGEFEAAQTQLRQGLKIADETHIAPLLLSVLAGYGELLAQYGDSEQGFEILGLILHHASSSHETNEEVKAMLERFENASPSALERGAKLELNAVVQELLAD